MNVFARTAGSAIGVAIFGAISNNLIAAGAGEHDYDTVVTAYGWVFVGVAITAVLMMAASLTMPRGRVNADDATRAPSNAGPPNRAGDPVTE
jgi:hypothetical protein